MSFGGSPRTGNLKLANRNGGPRGTAAPVASTPQHNVKRFSMPGQAGAGMPPVRENRLGTKLAEEEARRLRRATGASLRDGGAVTPRIAPTVGSPRDGGSVTPRTARRAAGATIPSSTRLFAEVAPSPSAPLTLETRERCERCDSETQTDGLYIPLPPDRANRRFSMSSRISDGMSEDGSPSRLLVGAELSVREDRSMSLDPSTWPDMPTPMMQEIRHMVDAAAAMDGSCSTGTASFSFTSPPLSPDARRRVTSTGSLPLEIHLGDKSSPIMRTRSVKKPSTKISIAPVIEEDGADGSTPAGNKHSATTETLTSDTSSIHQSIAQLENELNASSAECDGFRSLCSDVQLRALELGAVLSTIEVSCGAEGANRQVEVFNEVRAGLREITAVLALTTVVSPMRRLVSLSATADGASTLRTTVGTSSTDAQGNGSDDPSNAASIASVSSAAGVQPEPKEGGLSQETEVEVNSTIATPCQWKALAFQRGRSQREETSDPLSTDRQPQEVGVGDATPTDVGASLSTDVRQDTMSGTPASSYTATSIRRLVVPPSSSSVTSPAVTLPLTPRTPIATPLYQSSLAVASSPNSAAWPWAQVASIAQVPSSSSATVPHAHVDLCPHARVDLWLPSASVLGQPPATLQTGSSLRASSLPPSPLLAEGGSGARSLSVGLQNRAVASRGVILGGVAVAAVDTATTTTAMPFSSHGRERTMSPVGVRRQRFRRYWFLESEEHFLVDGNPAQQVLAPSGNYAVSASPRTSTRGSLTPRKPTRGSVLSSPYHGASYLRTC